MKIENKDIKVADVVTNEKKEDVSESGLDYNIKPKEQIFYWDDELDDCFEEEM